MRLRLRLLLLVISSLWKKRIHVLDESVLNLRVLPNDIDIKKITNDRFIALMDLGRMDIAFRTGLMKSMYKNNWVPLATFDTIRFRHALKIFQKYQLKTRIIWWDETTFYFKQVFERKGRVQATGYVSATLLAAQGPIPPNVILKEIGQPVEKPAEPEIIARLREIESIIHKSQRD